MELGFGAGAGAGAGLDLVAGILDAKDEPELRLRMAGATKACGFELFLIGLETPSPSGAPTHHITSGYPDPWQRIYAERNYVMRDPTVAYCQTHRDPVVWSQALFSNAPALEVWEEARAHGIGFGISVPTHERTGTKSMVSLVRDQSWSNDPREQLQLMSAAKVLASCAHLASNRLSGAPAQPDNAITLTPQEKNCLRWIAQGKTSWEIGQIMKIATPTVNFHLKNLMRKLDVVSRSQAIALAMRMNLLD